MDYLFTRQDKPFTLLGLMQGIIAFCHRREAVPEKIILPIDEYFFLYYLSDTHTIFSGEGDLYFMGIPVYVTLVKQKGKAYF